MENNSKKAEITIIRGEPDRPYARVTLKDRRSDPKDRRTLSTYLAADRRTGKADRRMKISSKK